MTSPCGSRARVRIGSKPVLDDLILWFIMGALLAWGAREAFQAWKHRPLVMWDEEAGRWRAAPRVHCQKR